MTTIVVKNEDSARVLRLAPGVSPEAYAARRLNGGRYEIVADDAFAAIEPGYTGFSWSDEAPYAVPVYPPPPDTVEGGNGA